MKPKWILLLAILASSIPAVSPTAQAATKEIMVYYMPWYSAKPYSQNWGWHWTMDYFNPDRINAAGEREIASWYYPLIGPYDSSDPAVLEYHVLLMKLAGVDGVIVDWYGSADFLDYAANNRATLKLFQVTRKAGLKFCICYEDQTIQHMLDAHYLQPSRAITQAQHEMLYLQTNFFGDASYLRLDGRPVLLNFGPQHFLASSNWETILSVLDATNKPAFFTEDNPLPISAGSFDWPPMWMSQAPGTGGVLSGAALKNYLAEFDRKASAWPLFISSAFPRFHDIYQRAGVRNYWGYLGDRQGEIFRDTLSRALTNSSSIAQIVTWNDYGEGTMVEPTHEYGYRDLGILQDLRRQYLQPDFSFGTNDLAIAFQFYNLRRRQGTAPAVTDQLARIFNNLASGEISAAHQQIRKLQEDSGPLRIGEAEKH
jgi:Glycosyl hydrolase family 99